MGQEACASQPSSRSPHLRAASQTWGLPAERVDHPSSHLSVLLAISSLMLALPVVSFCPCLCVEASNIMEILHRSPWMCQSGPAPSVKVTAGQLHSTVDPCVASEWLWEAPWLAVTAADLHCWVELRFYCSLKTEWRRNSRQTWAHSDSQGHTCLHVRHLWPR